MFFFGWRFSGRVFNKYFTCVIEMAVAPPNRNEEGRLVPASKWRGRTAALTRRESPH